MLKKLDYNKYCRVIIIIMMLILLPCSQSFSRMVTQIIPTLSISEEYSDNYFKRSISPQEEFITSYGLGFSIGFIDRLSEIYLAYNPEYRDFKKLNNRDGFLHKASLDSKFSPTKFTNINARLSYSGNTGNGNNENNVGDAWQNLAFIGGNTQVAKNTNIFYSERYSRNFDQQERTGNYRQHDTNQTMAGISHQFGEADTIGTSLSYSFDKADTPDADEYRKLKPSAFITYWLSPLNGLDSNISFEKADFDNSSNDIDTYSGHIRYLRKFSKQFDGYLKYRHSYSDRKTGDHQIYHPSVGFDWDVTKDSGVSLGIGALFHKWENTNKDSVDPFLDLDAYKIFEFSKRGGISITGSSGYSETGDTETGNSAASLGFSTYYQVGAQLNYQLEKRLNSNVFSTYRLTDYKETRVDRKDNRFTLGCGLSWLPLRWLQVRLSYTYTDFNTDASVQSGAAQRGDYKENRAFVSVSFIPEHPVRLDTSPSKQALETELFPQR